jgi:gas vesicle protein
MTTRDWIESGIALLCGMGAGAATMYLMDPELGERRRERITGATREALSATRQTLEHTLDTVKARAGAMSSGVGERLSDVGYRLVEQVQDSGQHAREQLERVRGRMDRITNRARGLVRHPARSAYGEHSAMGPTSITATAIGCAVAGAAVMYLFDPRQGRRRRTLIRDKVMSWTGRAGDKLEKTGRHWSDRASGLSAEMRSRLSGEQPSDLQLCARVRSEMGRWIGNPGQIQVQATNGRVTLRGPIEPGQRQQFIARVRSIPGVQDVEDQLSLQGEPVNRS